MRKIPPAWAPLAVTAEDVDVDAGRTAVVEPWSVTAAGFTEPQAASKSSGSAAIRRIQDFTDASSADAPQDAR
jgi:hypothetical protein